MIEGVFVTPVSRQFGPARPNGVVISDVTVEGGALEEPVVDIGMNLSGSNLSEIGSSSGDFNKSGDVMYFSVVVSCYVITYTAQDCGFGMGLLQDRNQEPAHSVLEIVQVSS